MTKLEDYLPLDGLGGTYSEEQARQAIANAEVGAIVNPGGGGGGGTTNVDFGIKITDATIPAGGVGVLGWLSAIWKRITDSLPGSLGPKTAATSFPVTLSSDGAFSTAFGAASDAAATSDTANTGLMSLFKRFLQRTANWGLSATPWFTKSNTYFQTYTIAKNAEAVAYAAGDVYGTKFELASFGPASGGGILLTEITLVSSVTGTTFPAGMGLFTLYLFDSEPLGITDNAAFTIHNNSITKQGVPLNSLSFVTNATNPSSVNYQINTLFVKGTTSLWGYVVTASAFTPTNNTANTMTIILSGMES